MKHFLILFFSWLFPGFGQIMLGHIGHGILIFIMLLSLYFTGMGMADYQSIQQPYYVICHVGVPTFFIGTLFCTENTPIVYGKGYEIGMLYMCVAGILNIIILLHLMERLSGQNASL